MSKDLDLFANATKAGIIGNPTFMKFGDPTTTGLVGVFARMVVWHNKFLNAMVNGMREWAQKVEIDMQQNARWTDRTGHARQALRAYLLGDDPRRPSFATADPPIIANNKEGDLVVVVTGFMDYNMWLEVRWGGRFAIMWPTVVRNNAEFTRIMVRHGQSVS
jgi:hypothetical protein